jgi:anti-anti-sigma factor
VVTLPAEIDIGNSGFVLAVLSGALASTPQVVVADGTGTGFCDCSAIAALVTIHRQAAAAGAQLRVVLASAAVRRAIELVGADDVLLVYPSLGEAQADGSQTPVTQVGLVRNRRNS